MTNSKTLLLSLVLTAAATVGSAQDRIFGAGITDACMQSANSQAALWKAQGVNATTVEKQFQALLAVCNGDSQLTAAFVGAANFDYTRFARLVAKNLITPNLYVALFQDRNRKLRLARNNPNWVLAYARGDADGDLVPDSMDRCPGTPDLTPTDDTGCPVGGDLPPAPSATDLQQVLNALHMTSAKNCDGAPTPDASSTLKFGYDDAAKASILNPLASLTGTFAIAASKVTNQPAGCTVFYEAELRYSQPAFGNAPDKVINVVFRDSENQDYQFDPTRMVFRAPYTAQGQLGDLYWTDLNAWYLTCEVRVRAMNGNGQSSGWGQKYKASWPAQSPYSDKPFFLEQ